MRTTSRQHDAPDGGVRLTSPVEHRLGEVPALDGVRAVAVIGVIVFHLAALRLFQPRWWPGGDLGVELFFVLSGFLITALLLAERSEHGRIDLPLFWARRLVRLVPPLVILLFAHAIYAEVEHLDPSAEATGSVSAIFYFWNLRMLWGWPATADLGHLWSLSIEEQFYLVWPVLLVVLMLLRTRLWLTVGLLVGSVGLITLRWSTMLDDGYPMFLLWVRTEVRADGLLVGCLAAMLYAYGKYPRRGLGIAATLCSVFVLGCYWRLPSDRPDFPYLELVFSTAAAVVILAAADGRWAGARLLALRPLRAIGRVSYGLYLWHMPAILWVSRHTDVDDERWAIALALLLTAAGALTSWFLVERRLQPLRHRLHPRRPAAVDLRASDPIVPVETVASEPQAAGVT